MDDCLICGCVYPVHAGHCHQLREAVTALNKIQMTHDDAGSWLVAEQALDRMFEFNPSERFNFSAFKG